ncbi:peroxiredoxin [Actomonas aquatica]|uniref:thioredoxin-dependent peroxiredoxin n=1 Tax=Actomonas aquatica TaxID=2866162 RepID=A0ABZ1C3L3_9BACT|nr:peroxiredoxin [Opitutus sp. WL0086]WRQ86306.1 peroxiredoxin [Opitutus sp. WL0086]
MKRRASLLTTVLFLTMLSFGTAAPLDVGAPAPAVSALTDEGSELNLADVYSSHDYTLVYFYPKADTPGCTKQGCSLRDAYEELTDQGVAVIGVSYDTVEKQAAFKEKYHFPFTLLADTEKAVAKAFGANGMIMASRSAYLVHDGKIVYADHKGSTTEQANDIIQFLAK